MPAPVALAAIPIITAAGRFAAPYLAKELGKLGMNKFVSTYGKGAFNTLESLNKNTTMVKPEAMPMVNPNYMSSGSDDDDTNVPMVQDQQKSNQPQQEPPEDKGPNLGTEVATEAALEISKNLSKEEDIKSQTQKALEPKVEFGTLTETEKQTAQALMGDQPEFYSRVVKSIKDAKPNKLTKNKWKSFIQGDKEELKFLGLDKFLQGNESITKQELLDFVEKKDITSGITVRSIPEDEMNTMYEGYSLGYAAKKGTQENIVFQFGRKNLLENAVTSRPYEAEITPLFKSEHFDTEYGTNTFAHARTQVGYDQLDTLPHVPEDEHDRIKKNEKIFRNTLIIDEIQSDWLQKGREKGFFSDFDVVANKDLKEYLDKNNIKYTIYNQNRPIEREFESEDSPLMVNEENIIQLKSTTPGSTSRRIPLNVDNRFELFEKKGNHAESVLDVDNIKQAKNYFLRTGMYGVPDFPIKESKKWVELVLNEMIKKATADGRDSIAITNGQIQYNRYDYMEEKKRKGLKKFYDTIVYDQLKKIADKYNVTLERVDITEGEAPKELQDIHFDNQISRAEEDGFVLKKVNLQFLWDRTRDTDIPGHASLFSERGVGQGSNYIEDYLSELVDNRPFSPAGMERSGTPTGTGSGLDKWNEIRNNEVYIWIKEQDISRDRIGWELPIVPVNDAYNKVAGTQETKEFFSNLENQDLEIYKQYIKNVDIPKGEQVDPGQLIKMKLPKKLQKEILSKPIKLSKAKQQTDRLFA